MQKGLGEPMPSKEMRKILQEVYQRLLAALGPQHWWPAQTPFEVMVGAVLTQNTSWANVEKAIRRLKDGGLLSPRALQGLSLPELEELVRPSGFYRVKARRLKALVDWLMEEFQGNLGQMFKRPLDDLRLGLLAVGGVGPETADSILLYAARKPTFVIDAYTRRILSRHRWARRDANYDELKQLFENNLRRGEKLFNEYHALLVVAGKRWCKPHPVCRGCPLEPMLSDPRPA